MFRVATTCCLILMLAGSTLAQRRQEDPNKALIEEFKREIRHEDVAVRRDQVERLARVQTAEAVDLLFTRGLTDADNRVRDEAIQALAMMDSGEAREALLAGLESRQELLREAVLLALGSMRHGGSPPVALVAGFLREDPDDVVRTAAAEVLGMFESADALPALLDGLADRAEAVVISSADSVALLENPIAVQALIKTLNHPSWRAQVAALNALGRIRSKDSVPAIIAYLEEAKGRPREDAHRALVRVTQFDFDVDAGRWHEWWERVKEGWTVPPIKSGEEVIESRDGYGRSGTTYHRITTESKRILFVIDISTSMKEPILLKRGRQSNKAPPSRLGTPKIDLAREELAFALRGMDPDTYFNVIAFETEIRYWKARAVRAGPGNIQAALRWITRQEPQSSSTSGMKSSTPRDRQGRLLGRTNTYGALRAVFGLGETGGVTRSSKKPLWDTCFFLTDGEPTEGVVTKVEDILAEVRRLFRESRIRIHTIGMNESGALQALLQGIATITEGQCVYVGR